MTHHRTVLSISRGQAIRKSRSEEYLPSSHKAEETLDLRRSSAVTKTIPSFSKLGRELRIRFESKEQREAKRESVEECSREQDPGHRSWNLRSESPGGTISKQKDSLHRTVDSEPGVKIKMSLVQSAAPEKTVNDLREARDTIKKLNESLLNEKRLSEAKDTTIGNLRHEINLLDQELVDKRKENDKYNEEMRKLRSKTTSLETENKILERQVKMMNESNKRLHHELHELRNKLRIQETKVGELRVQRSEAVRKYAHLLQTSVDKSTRLRYFLQQLQNEILSNSITSKKFQIKKQALEDLMQEDSEEDLQFKKYGLISPRKMRRASYLLSEEEKESLRKDVESALVSRQNKVRHKSFPIEKLTTATERIVTEGLKSRLGRENEESSQMSKLMHEAKHQIKGLERIDSSHVEASKRLEDKVGTQLKALDAELKDLSDELRLAQISKREDEEKLRSIRKFSTVDVKVESISLSRRASQVEKLDLESAISCMERRSEDSTSPMSPTEIEILSMKQKMATILEEKLMISDELIESRTSLSNLESLLQSRSLENEKMEMELTDKEKRISLTENSLKEAQIETTNLKEELVAAKDEISSREREGIAQLEGKAKDRPHRVELNFTPNIQPVLEQKVENLKEELLAVRRNSVTQPNQVIPASRGVDKGIQVGDEPRKLERHRSWESPRSVRRSFSLDQTDVCESPRSVRRRMSLDQTTYGHAKVKRKFSRTEVKLVQRAEKGVQVEIIEQLGTTPENSREDEVSRETLTKENQELKTILEQQHREIASLEHEIKKLQGNKNDSSCDGEDNAPFNYPKRVSELWTSLEEARQEKAEGDKRNKELQDELEKQEQEIQVIIKNLKHPGTERESEIIHTSRTDILTQNNNYLKENELVITEQSRTLQELVSSSERNYLDHEFVFDSQDGRCIPSEPRLEVAADKNEKTIPRLEMVIDRLRKELMASETQSRKLETELYRKEEDLRKAGSELEFYKTKLSEKKLDETSEEKGELVQYKTQVSDLNALLEETRIEKRRAEEESERYKTQISELRVSIDQTRKDNSNIELYKSQISHLKSSLDKTKRENEISATEILQCNSQIRDLKTSLEDARKGFHRTEKEISMYKSEISELKSSLDETKMEKQNAKEVSERSKARISELKASLDDSKKELSSAKKEIELYKSEIFELKSHLAKTERENRHVVDEREQCKSQISSLEASLEETKRENVSAGEEAKKNKSEILELKSSLDERRREYDLVTGEIQRYKSQIRDMKVSLEDVKRESSWNLKEIDRYKHEMSDLKISLGRSKKESANVTKEYELYKFEISDLQTSLEEERKENRAAAKTTERYKSEISDLKSSLEKAKEENRTAGFEIERFKTQITDLQASLEGKRKESLSAANKTEKCQREISDLKSSVFKAKEEIRTATNDIERYKKQIFDLQAALEGERKENQAAASKIEKRESDISNLKSSLDKAREDNRSLENGIERFKKQISDLQASLEGERNENLATTKKIHKCESEIFELRNSFDKKNEETFNVTSDIESYKTQVSNLQATLENTIKDNRRRESKNDELQRELNKMEETVQENKMKEAEIRLEKGRLETGNSKLQITIDNLKNQLMRTDKKMKDLELRAEEDNKTISQLMDEQSGIGRLQQQVKVLETKLSVRDKNLEQKVDEIIERDQRIEQLARENDELMKKVEEISSQREEKPVYQFDTIDGASKGDVLENEVVPTFNQQLQSPREQDELVKNVDKISSKRQEKPTYFDTIDETTESAILGNEVVRNFNEQLQSRREQDELVKKVEEISSKREEKPAYFDSIDRASQTDVLGNEVVRDFNQQLQSPQTALKGIHQEKAYLEDTVLQLTNVKNSQDKELDLLRQQIQLLESSVQDTERSLETNVQQMVMKEKELRELVNEKVVKTSQIESLESSLSMALRDRDSTLAGKRINNITFRSGFQQIVVRPKPKQLQ